MQKKKKALNLISCIIMKDSLLPKICVEKIKYDIWTLSDKNLNARVGRFLSSYVSREQWIKDISVWCYTYLFNLC